MGGQAAAEILDPLESFQLQRRADQGGEPVVQVKLGDLLSIAVPGIGDGKGNFDFPISWDFRRGEMQVGIAELGTERP